MRLEHRIKDLEKKIIPNDDAVALTDGPPGKPHFYSLQNWTDEEIDRAINLLNNDEEWPEELQRKREATRWPKNNLSTAQQNRRINELLVQLGGQPVDFD